MNGRECQRRYQNEISVEDTFISNQFGLTHRIGPDVRHTITQTVHARSENGKACNVRLRVRKWGWRRIRTDEMMIIGTAWTPRPVLKRSGQRLGFEYISTLNTTLQSEIEALENNIAAVVLGSARIAIEIFPSCPREEYCLRATF